MKSGPPIQAQITALGPQEFLALPEIKAVVLQRIAQSIALTIIVFGTLVMVGWVFQISFLVMPAIGEAVTKANITLSMLLFGISLWALIASKRTGNRAWFIVSRLCAAIGATIGLLSLAENLFHCDFGIDQLVGKDIGDPHAMEAPGRMGPNTALGILLSGASLLLVSSKIQAMRRIGFTLNVLVFMLGLVSIGSYLYKVPYSYQVKTLTQMAFRVACSFVVLPLGIFCAIPNEGPASVVAGSTPGGFVARRLLPVALVPPMLGWLRVNGEKLGLYPPEFGLTIATVFMMSLLGGLVFWIASALSREDAVRKYAAQLQSMSELLARSNEELQQLTNAIGSLRDYGVFLLDATGTVKTWNEGAIQINGYRPEEIIGQHIAKFYTAEDIEAGKPALALKKAATEGRFEDESWRIRKDGSKFFANVVVTAMKDNHGDVTGFLKVTRDVTERRLADVALRETEQRLQLATAAGRVAVWDLDLLKNTAWRSLTHDQIFGYDELQPEWNLDIFMQHLVAEDRAYAQERFAQAVESGTLSFECRIVRSDGEVRWLSAQGEVFRDAQQNPVRMTGTAIDTTEQKQLAEKLQKQAELLESAHDELKRSNTELEQFAYIASHDLQEPLRGVAGCLQILDQKYGERLDEKANKLIEHAVDGATRMRKLIEDLLLLSRVSSGGATFQSVDLSEVLAKALKNLRASIEESAAKITWDALPIVPGDQSQLTQLFQNLIGNAIKYRSEKIPEIHIAISHEPGRYVVSVRDNGIGFEQRYAERIFLAFKRLHSRTEYTGTGIGLAICQKIVKRHGGTIWANSEPTKGATFYFSLQEQADYQTGNPQ